MISAFVNARRLARVDQDQPFVVLDEPNINGQPLGPFLIEKHIGDLTQHAFASCLSLRRPDLNKARANGMDFQHSLIVISGPANLIFAGREMTHFLHPRGRNSD